MNISEVSSQSAANYVAPMILYVGLLPGAVGMNLPRCLVGCGFHQRFLGVDDAYISHSGFIKKRYIVNPSTKGFSLEVLAQAIDEINPTLIVPVDDLAVLSLQKLATTPLKNADKVYQPLQELIERSIGAVKGYGLSNPRAKAYDIARTAGVKVPEQVSVFTVSDIERFVSAHGYPIVLKRERSMAGDGVHILHDAQELEALVHKIGTQFDPSHSFWVVQQYVAGTLAIHAVYADQGKVLAHISAVQVQTKSNEVIAPSSIVRLIQNTQLEQAANAFVKSALLSGFHGWDFQINEHTDPILIEHNPRVISISHLAGAGQRSLLSALVQRYSAAETRLGTLLNQQAEYAGNLDMGREVCLFPFEWHRMPSNPKLVTAHHDAPWNDPALLRYVVNC